MKWNFACLMTLALGLSACQPESSAQRTPVAGPGAGDTSAQSSAAGKQARREARVQLHQLFLDFETDYLALNPFQAMFRGNMDHNHRLGDILSDDYVAASRQLEYHYLDRLGHLDPDLLQDQDRISFDIFRYDRELALARHDSGVARFWAMLPINQFQGFHLSLPMMARGFYAQPFETVKDYDNWLARMGEFPAYVDAAIARMRQGMEVGIVLPEWIQQRVLEQLRQHAVDPDIDGSDFWYPVVIFPDHFGAEDRERLTSAIRQQIEQQIFPAYRDLYDFFRDQYMAKARDNRGIGGLPGGKQAYLHAVKAMTTTDLTPERIHHLGLAEVKRLTVQMESIMKRVNFDGDLHAFFDFLLEDPRFFYQRSDQLLAAYQAIKVKVAPQLPKLFKHFPQTDYQVREMEGIMAMAMPPAQYVPGAADGTRPGAFLVNTHYLDTRPNWMTEAISLHEAAPGHHFQIALNQEAGALPPFRKFARYNAYVEGWGLYAELLGESLGLYQDPYQQFGMLYAQLWRANRLVVDTGLHAKGWTRQQAIDYMVGNSPIPRKDAEKEVDRYLARPGQALGYMIGRMTLLRLRNQAQDALGPGFDVREFHHQVLKDGAMPLVILETKVANWIRQQQVVMASQ